MGNSASEHFKTACDEMHKTTRIPSIWQFWIVLAFCRIFEFCGSLSLVSLSCRLTFITAVAQFPSEGAIKCASQSPVPITRSQGKADAAEATKNQGGWYNSMVWECGLACHVFTF